MAFRKECDFDRKLLGEEANVPYIQLHGTVSEQRHDEDGLTEYHYLTDYFNSKLAFCNAECLAAWVRKQAESKPFFRRRLAVDN